VHEPVWVTGALAGGGPHVKMFATDNDEVLRSFFAYDPNFHGGVNVALGDVNGDGYQDIITAPGAGGGPHVKVFSGKTGVVLREFMAYEQSFNGGVFVASCDVNNDGKADIITGAGAGGGPHVKVFDGVSPVNATLASFFAYNENFHGGVRVASADLDGDGKADLVTAPGPGGGPHVRAFKISSGGAASELFGMMAYDPNFTGGVFVGANVGADQVARIVTGAGPGAGMHVRVFNSNGGEIAGVIPGGSGAQGAMVAIGQLDGDNPDEYALGNATGASLVRTYDLPAVGVDIFEAYPGFGGGTSIAVGVR
jgi:hypothetical protein